MPQKPQTIAISCGDARVVRGVLNRETFPLTTIGGAVLEGMPGNIQHAIELGELLEIQVISHHDCGATRIRQGFSFDATLGSDDLSEVDKHSRDFALSEAAYLVEHPLIAGFIVNGGKVCVYFDPLHGDELELLQTHCLNQ